MEVLLMMSKNCKTNSFLMAKVFTFCSCNLKHSFFYSTALEWNQLDFNIQNRKFISFLKNIFLTLYDIPPRNNSSCYIPKGINYITHLIIGLSHLRERRFKNSSQDILDLFCDCGSETLFT